MMKYCWPYFRDCRAQLRPNGCWLLVALLILPALPVYSQTPTKSVVQNVGLDQHLNAQIPLDLTFRDEQGRTVKLGDYFGDKPVVLTLVYYRCPMLCTQVLNGFLESSQAVKLTMGADYHVVSVSIDPRETTSMAREKKKRYADSYHRPGAQEGWHFLTGSAASIEQLTKAVGYRYVYDPKTDQYAHASGIMILTPAGKISRYLYGIDYAPDDLRLALVEASQSRIGTLTDRFLLLCYHYDPATGQYGFAIERAIRAAGLATMAIMGGFLWLMFRRERQRTRATAAREEVLTTADREQE
ncbi:MAG: SCO family protein [Planctomycetota bacterium]